MSSARPQEVHRMERRNIRIGTADLGSGREPVFIDVEIRERAGDGEELAISSHTSTSGGQDYDSVNAVDEYAAGWDRARTRRLLEVWRRWHLNGMNAACEHQRAAGWGEQAGEPVTLYHWRLTRDVANVLRDAEKDATARLRAGEEVRHDAETLRLLALPRTVTTSSDQPPAVEYEPNGPQYAGDAYNRASETKTRGWVRFDEHAAGLLGKPCEVCGYAYGSAWLFEPLPADVRAFVVAIIDEEPEPAAVVTLEVVGGPDYAIDAGGWEHHAFKVRLTRGRRSVTVDWKQGLGHGREEPEAGAVLSSMILDAGIGERGYDDAVSEFGADGISRETFNACKRQAAKLERWLGADDYEATLELGNDEAAAYRIVHGLDITTGAPVALEAAR